MILPGCTARSPSGMRCAMADSRAIAARASAGGDWIVPGWPAPSAVFAFTTTRRHPRTGADFDARAASDDAAWLPCLDAAPLWLAQVHGTAVLALAAGNLAATRAQPPRADAWVTRLRHVPVAIRHADCLPVLLADDAGQVIGAAHAGWRGLAAGIIEATVAAMDVDPATVVAWLGPAIGPGAFEVGRDVVAAFTANDADAISAFRATGPDKWHADLHALARGRLNASGVSRVHGVDTCTHGDRTRFYSHRRDGDPRRMASVIVLR